MTITYKYGLPLEITWEEFVRVSSHEIPGEQLDEIKFKLLADGIYHGGSDSEPEYVITATQQEMERHYKFPAPELNPRPDNRAPGNA